MIDLYQKRLPAPDRELVHTPDHPAHGVVRQGPHGVDAVHLLDLRLGGEHRIGWQAPVDDLRRAAPRQQLPGLDLLAVSGRVRPLGPHNRSPITPGNQDKPLAGGRRAIVSGHKLPVLHNIPQCFKLAFPPPEGLARQLLDRLPLADRAPGNELLHVLQDNHPGPDGTGPPQDDPGKAADIAVNQRRALGLAEVLAVR